MNPTLQFVIFEALRYVGMGIEFANSWWNRLWMWYLFPSSGSPTRRYFLSDDQEFNESMTHVPKDAVYIEEWVNPDTHEKKCTVLYEGQQIPKFWPMTPFEDTAKCPWIWVGDRSTEIDLTRTFNKFLVIGNQIRPALVNKLIRVGERTNLVYIETGTFKEVEFPGDGILIKRQDE
jgi:hypothetical protein